MFYCSCLARIDKPADKCPQCGRKVLDAYEFAMLNKIKEEYPRLLESLTAEQFPEAYQILCDVRENDKYYVLSHNIKKEIEKKDEEHFKYITAVSVGETQKAFIHFFALLIPSSIMSFFYWENKGMTSTYSINSAAMYVISYLFLAVLTYGLPMGLYELGEMAGFADWHTKWYSNWDTSNLKKTVFWLISACSVYLLVGLFF